MSSVQHHHCQPNAIGRGRGTTVNFEAWREIIQHYGLHYPDVKEKKATLQSLALVSRQLTPLAQSEIWRTVHGVSHVVAYINDAEESNIRIYNTSLKVLRQPIGAKTLERVRGILSSTRNFILDRDLDFLDFEFIQMTIGGPLHLFSNLKTLLIDWNHIESSRNILPFLASPGIESLTYRYLGLAGTTRNSLLLFHSTLRMHSAPIKSVSIQSLSSFSPSIIPRLLHCAPSVALSIQHPQLSNDDHFKAWCFAFSMCPSLTSLTIRTSECPPSKFWNTRPGNKNKRYHFANLRQLELEGCPKCDFLLERLECPSLTNLILTIHTKPEEEEPHVFSSAAHFKKLESLSIAFKVPQPLSLDELQPLIDSSSTLQHLEITGVTSQLTEANIEYILSTKPSLQQLVVYGPASHALPPSVLFTITRHRLHIVGLPIHLIEPTSIDDVRARRHPLTHLFVPESAILPESTTEKLKLAKFIYHMFPSAEICHSDSGRGGFGQSVKELEEMQAYISQLFERA